MTNVETSRPVKLGAPQLSNVSFYIDEAVGEENGLLANSQVQHRWKPSRLLVLTHLLSVWGARAWEFTVSLALLDLFPTSFLLVSVFGLADSLAQVILVPIIGQWTDRTCRLRAALILYGLQNCSVALSGTLLLLAKSVSDTYFYIAVSLAIATGSLASVGAAGASIIVERDMPRLLCAGDASALARLNSTMRRVDLISLIASPIFVSFIMSGTGSIAWGCGFIVLYNIFAWLPEWKILEAAYSNSPALQTPKLEITDLKATSQATYMEALRVYFSQSCLAAALSLAMLYLTVLSFGPLMTAYLKYGGMKETELAVWRGAGAAAGILATLAFPYLQKTLKLSKIAVMAICLQFICLVLGVLMNTSRLLVLGLVCSRFGLWLFDLAVGQLLQETVPDGQLGAVSGVQSSLQSLFQMFSFIAGIILWQPDKFWLLMIGSCCVVCFSTSTSIYFHIQNV